MSEEQIRFLPYDEAVRLVAAIQEEEDLDDPDHRILTVYSRQEKEICWFDFEEVMHDAGIQMKYPDAKEKVTEYVMHHIPDWALEI
jgi:predicted ATPase